MNPIRSIGRSAAASMIKRKRLREHMVFVIKQRHYDDLQQRVLLSDGLACPVEFEEALYSFSEVFVREEYAPALANAPLPGRWLDLGAHAGYFSLYLVWKRLQAGLTPGSGLLIDADERVAKAIATLIGINELSSSLSFLRGLISVPDGNGVFVQRSGMESSSERIDAQGGDRTSVKILTEAEILEALAPPYDLIKVDIEGGEFDFLTAYTELLSHTNRLILEWHSWHCGGGGWASIEELLGQRGFDTIFVVAGPTPVGDDRSCGVIVAQRTTTDQVRRPRTQ
ncbi:MAG TPA: FkbM family methyltransferase [Fimbriimonadaceae bacterium]|nr:FkbM family methyltransferase [Fimbriimonadaceae bacterium]